MIRKYATAFTRTGTLSFVITSCGGTFRVTVRRSTRTILSMIGMSRKMPGPLGGDFRRPSRKITPRSYSRATRTDAERKMSSRIATAATAISLATGEILLRLFRWSHAWRRHRKRCLRPGRGLFGAFHFEHEPLVDPFDPHGSARRQRFAFCARLPELPMDEDETLRAERLPDDAGLADELARPGHDRR